MIARDKDRFGRAGLAEACVQDQFNGWEGREYNKFVPVLVGNGTKIAPTRDIFDQPPDQM